MSRTADKSAGGNGNRAGNSAGDAGNGKGGEFDIVIVGGGLAGACMANLLVREGVAAGRILLVEPRLGDLGKPPGDEVDLRVSAISRATENILSACGVWERLRAGRINPYERMCVWDEGGQAQGRGAIHFDCADLGQPNLGYIIENSAMQVALLERAREIGVRMIAGQVVRLEPRDAGGAIGQSVGGAAGQGAGEAIGHDGAGEKTRGKSGGAGGMNVELQDGTEIEAGLVIAADGGESPARKMMGIEARGASYGQQAIVTHIRTAGEHQRTAWQRFLSTGPIALLPLRDGRCSIVWSTSEEAARGWMVAPEADFCRGVEAATDGVLGAVDSCVKRAAFPLRRIHAEKYVLSRFALVGDAAHTLHPLAGQGVNLSFLDCAALAEVVGEAVKQGRDCGELGVLRRYERWRKGENLLMLAALDGLNGLFSNDSTTLGPIRRTGLTLLDRIGPAKNAFMRRALGLAGDLPRLATDQ